jgi:hypothetical protein
MLFYNDRPDHSNGLIRHSLFTLALTQAIEFDVKTIPKTLALRIGLASIVVLMTLQLFNGVVCYGLSPGYHLVAFGLVSLAFLPGLVALYSRNPLRTVGAALLFAPWLVIAYYTDCVLPPRSAASSMSYLMVVVYGLPSAAIGALITAPILRLFRLTVIDA